MDAWVTLSYKTDYSYLGGYYIVDDQNITLNCVFDVTRQTVRWSAGGSPIYNFHNGKMAAPSSIYKNRIRAYQYTEREHQIVLMVNKSVDEGQQFRCAVPIDLITDEDDDIQIQEILGELDIFPLILVYCFATLIWIVEMNL